MKRAGIIFSMLMLMLAACGRVTNQSQIAESANNIIGGKKVEAEDPISHSVVALYNAEETYLCTGTLIADDTVMTAGHCVNGKPKSLVVIFGLDIKAQDPVIRKVSAEVRHENYVEDNQSDVKNDIALVKFDGGLPKGYFALPILTKARGLTIQSGTAVTFAGYGLDKNWFGDAFGKSGVLRKVDVTLKKVNVTENEVEISDWRKGTCSGDSGGPGLVTVDGHSYVWGITSRGGSLGKLGACVKTGIYTRVEAYAPWVKAHIGRF